jgi:hypothetical protein
MNISGTYTSLQPVIVGDLVQLVLNRQGAVMQLYEKQILNYEVPNLNNLITMQLYGDYLIVVRLPGIGFLSLELYTKGSLTWTQTLTTLQFSNISLVIGSSGIFLLFDSVGITHLPGVSISQSPITILSQFGFDSNLLSVCTISSTTSRSIVYDNTANTIYLYGTLSTPLRINNSTVVNRNSLYSFAISLSTTLVPINTLVAEAITIELLAVNNGNIAFTERNGSSTSLNYVSVDNTGFTVSLGLFTTYDLQFYSNFIAVLGNELLVNAWYVYQFLFDGTEIAKTTVSLPQTIEEATLAFNLDRFIVYAISRLAGGNYILSEFDIYDSIEVWSTPIPPNSTNLSGVTSELTISYPTTGCSNTGTTCPSGTTCCSNTIRVYGKRLPYFIGAVSEVIWPNGTGTTGPSGCIEGFSPCSECPIGCTGCTGSPICCSNVVIPNCGIPYIVTVDFIKTNAFSPVIAGQEYYINILTGRVTTDETLGRYLGTAIDDETVVMLSSGCTC